MFPFLFGHTKSIIKKERDPMKIAVFEEIPLIRTRLFALLQNHPHRERIQVEPPLPREHYDLVLWEGARFTPRLSAAAQLTLVPFSVPVLHPPTAGLLLTGGMEGEASVSFSSIGEDSALLCVARELRLRGESVLPFERPVPFDRNFTLYKNLAAGFALSLADLYFGEVT